MKPTRTIVIVLFVALALLIFWRAQGPNQRGVANAPEPVSGASPLVPPPVLRMAVEQLRHQPSDSEKSRKVLDELRSHLAAMPKPDAISLLRLALESGTDAATGLDFKPDGKGGLTDVSSLRVFLLDQLRALDPEAAREFARAILARPTTADEWALSLAVVATDPTSAGREFLRQKSREMVLHEPWQREPSAGFLEAFDAFVFNRDTEFVPELSSMLAQTNNRALAHAAFLTLDRLVQAAPAVTLDSLLQQPGLGMTREATRAGYFARADVRDPAQLGVLEKFLLSSSIGSSERDRFLAGFPGANFMVSANLLTSSATPPGSEIAARDQATLRVVEGWIKDAQFASLRPGLESVRRRLEKFIAAPQ